MRNETGGKREEETERRRNTQEKDEPMFDHRSQLRSRNRQIEKRQTETDQKEVKAGNEKGNG